MSEIMTPGAPTAIPAGYATQSLAGGLPTLTLSAQVGASELLEFTGALTMQDIVVVIPTPLFPTQVVGSYSGPTVGGWSKIVKNSTTGPFNVVLQAQNGTNTLIVPQGQTMWVYSPDGVQVFQGSGASGSTVITDNALAAGIVFRPGGVASANVFPTWPAVMAAFALTNGNVNIEIDDSIAPAILPVGISDLQGRGYLVGANPSVQAVLTIPDGAQLLNPSGWFNLNITTLHTASALLSLKFSLGTKPIQIAQFAQITNNGTLPAVDVEPSGAALFFFMVDDAALKGGGTGAEIFNIPAGKVLAIRALAGSRFFQGQFIMSGAGSYQFLRDTTAGIFKTDPTQFTGAVIPAAGVLFEGIVQHDIAAIGAGTYVVDATFFSGVDTNAVGIIYCKPTGAGTTIINLPDATLPMNKGRLIRIVDANGTSNVNTITLTPFGAQLLNGVNASKNLSSSWGIWTVACDGAQWIVAVSAGI